MQRTATTRGKKLKTVYAATRRHLSRRSCAAIIFATPGN